MTWLKAQEILNSLIGIISFIAAIIVFYFTNKKNSDERITKLEGNDRKNAENIAGFKTEIQQLEERMDKQLIAVEDRTNKQIERFIGMLNDFKTEIKGDLSETRKIIIQHLSNNSNNNKQKEGDG